MDDKDITVGTLADQLGVGRNNLYSLLRTCGVFNKANMPHQRFKGMGLFKILPHTIPTHTDKVIIANQALFTPKGAEWFREKLQLLFLELQSTEPLKNKVL